MRARDSEDDSSMVLGVQAFDALNWVFNGGITVKCSTNFG